jgi:hypothetical protein
MERETRSSLYIAPLQIVKSKSAPATSDPISPGQGLMKARMTPPLTPHVSKEESTDQSRNSFPNYLRAFYPFHSPSTVSPSTVTLPLNRGDIILVHSVHTNGWADGTLLETGARGWLPTNYCEEYDHHPMRHLLKALTDFWDIMRGGSGSTLEIFGNQDYMRGLIAGVRFLLVSLF